VPRLKFLYYLCFLNTNATFAIHYNHKTTITKVDKLKNTATICNGALNLGFILVSYFLFFPFYSTTTIALGITTPSLQHTYQIKSTTTTKPPAGVYILP
jgi:hypothetical protein